ncbi:hypothetical protein CYY_010522 [Polysphondylium violaceum]|uniref:Uncharacterized protein n=1 Tax=Polysphondylium violaceum TaxID=133409 RepID=A0A8J4PJQ7_9MYCE|nr:hypothetical protein CYY_010522 [Polysphondylium violaceum]
MQDTIYAVHMIVYFQIKYPNFLPIGPLIRNRYTFIVSEEDATDSYLSTIGDFLQLSLKRKSFSWCGGNKIQFCLGRVDPNTIKDSPTLSIELLGK